MYFMYSLSFSLALVLEMSMMKNLPFAFISLSFFFLRVLLFESE